MTSVDDAPEKGKRRPRSAVVPPGAAWLTIVQAADRAQVSVPTLRREIDGGRLRACRVGGRKELRFTPAMIDEWLFGGEIGGRHG